VGNPFTDARATRDQQGFTLLELLIVAAVISALAAISVPGLIRARRSSLESAAIASMRSITSAEATYASSCARGGYAQALDDLAKPAPGAAQLFISPDIPANGAAKSGYVFNVGPDIGAKTVLAAATTCNSASLDAVSGYFSEAHPELAATGQRAFASDTRGIIFFNTTGATIAAGMAGADPLR
jgi:type IV pilus assembly protein PilA